MIKRILKVQTEMEVKDTNHLNEPDLYKKDF